MFFHAASDPPERAADPAVRRANLRRIGPLFTPYKLRLGGVLLLIVASAGLGVGPRFFRLTTTLDNPGIEEHTESTSV